ncbi:hypothetical protein [Paenibacillus sp. BJ-4]|nr:hypothetical protein [Paenibacillus sp. BJ-4]
MTTFALVLFIAAVIQFVLDKIISKTEQMRRYQTRMVLSHTGGSL